MEVGTEGKETGPRNLSFSWSEDMVQVVVLKVVPLPSL